MSERRRRATVEEARAALFALDGDPLRVAASDWPGALLGLDQPGLYSWWTDDAGAADLADGLGVPIEPGRIYAGQAGATRWPSGTVVRATLGSRIRSNHLRGRVSSSTFRLTLAASLLRSLGLVLVGPTLVEPASEQAVGAWIRAHLHVAVFVYADRDALADLEDRVLAQLDPPLNLDGMPPTSARLGLAKLRAVITRGPDPGQAPADEASEGLPQRQASMTAAPAAPAAPAGAVGATPVVSERDTGARFTRDEIAAIRSLLVELRRSDRSRQKVIRRRLRARGFHISDYAPDAQGFTASDLDELIARGTITVDDG